MMSAKEIMLQKNGALCAAGNIADTGSPSLSVKDFSPCVRYRTEIEWRIGQPESSGTGADKGEHMKVKNLKGSETGDASASRLAAWERLSGQNAFMCFATGCIKRPSSGGRVQKDSATDKSWYLIPLCDECSSKSGQDLDIWDAAPFIPVHAFAAAGSPAEPLKRATSPLYRGEGRRILSSQPRNTRTRAFQGLADRTVTA
jgi:hypothetical protein